MLRYFIQFSDGKYAEITVGEQFIPGNTYSYNGKEFRVVCYA